MITTLLWTFTGVCALVAAFLSFMSWRIRRAERQDLATRAPTFRPDFGIEPPAVRRADAAFWLVIMLLVIVVAGAIAVAIWGTP